MEQNPYIIWFEDLTIKDVPKVGGKNAALGEMVRELIPLGIAVPGGFAVTAAAYRHFIAEAGLEEKIREALEGLDTHDVRDLARRGKAVRNLILRATLPADLAEEITAAYRKMCDQYGENTDVAVRSSATAEDLPGASFAGQQETFLNIVGEKAVLESAQKCIASLFTDRAISYRVDKGFSHMDVALSVGVQKMVRSDLASSGVFFTIDTETGFDKVVMVNSSYGLGEILVQGKIIPDEFMVFKPALEAGKSGIISKTVGMKSAKIVYGRKGTTTVNVPKEEQSVFSITDDEVRTLAEWGIEIEKHFAKKRGEYMAMDVEWAKDGKTGELFILQARPETVHAIREKGVYTEHRLKGKAPESVVSGIAVGTKIAHGPVRVIKSARHIDEFKKGEVLVTEITDPDWEPIMKIAAAIVTNKGGRTSHAAIVSRELGIPAIVGTENATKVLKTGEAVTVDCASGEEGAVYKGEVAFGVIEHRLGEIPETKTKVMVNIGAPDEAIRNHYLPAKGVGLGRLEFIISSSIGIHPNALINFEKLNKSSGSAEREVAQKIAEKTDGWEDKKKFYVDKLAEGIGKIGAASHPHEVIIRFSDFKTNEYRTLIGGALYEPEEANPMIGWRGASRYYHDDFKEAFGLECAAIKKVRGEMGVSNVVVMVPFCRTIEEGEKVLSILREHGLDKDADETLKVYMMCEIPSNVVLAREFLEIFDGLSIGSNDLTQLTLGIDRDSELVSGVGNENNEAVKRMVSEVIKAAKEKQKYVGICGQAPSDFPEFAAFLVEEGIESMSLTPDVVIKTLKMVADKEKKV